MGRFGLDVPVNGMPVVDYIMDLVERNERKEVDLQRTKLTVKLLKTSISRSRLEFQVAKYERENGIAVAEFQSAQSEQEPNAPEDIEIKPVKGRPIF